jgi:DNA polymerase I-like protein with 3'-5' exonuclease and polymerase domains
MNILTVDFETYYDKDFSLSKMQTDAYIIDPRFEVVGVCVKKNDEEPVWFSGDELQTKDWLMQFDWANSAVRCHNTMFDGFIMTYRFGIKPKLWMDTLAQARMLYPYLHSHSLANMAKHFGLADKGTEVTNALGIRRNKFSAAQLREYAAYCMHDTNLCAQMGTLMDPFTPALETHLIDMTVRMFTEPMLVGDTDKMKSLHQNEMDRKTALLEQAETVRDEIMSNDKFAIRLMTYGVTPPTKTSKTTGKETFAFSKSDKEFTDLLNHDIPEVQALVSARLGVKTTIAETRALKFVEMAERGPLPVYLNFWGAKTTGRYSGGNKVNWQNLPARGPSAGLRDALLAPEGHTVLVGDSSNIELRMVMALAGQWDVVEKLKNGVDLYCDFASKLFGRNITKADKAERFLGKTAMLGLQYGAGAPRFQEMVRLAARQDRNLQEIELQRAYDIVSLYRQVHPQVVELWDRCHNWILPDIANGCSLLNVDVNGWFITQNNGFGRPGEPGVMYHDLQYNPRTKEWEYSMGRSRIRIYGPKIVENLSQHAAMRVVMWQTARINQKYPVKLSVHDEAVAVPKTEEITEARRYMEECLSLAPKWCRDHLPLACETGIGKSYGDAK